MFRFIRSWYVINNLSRRSLKEPASLDTTGTRNVSNSKSYVDEHVFLTQLAEKNIFGCARAPEKMYARMAKDKSIIDFFLNENPKMIEEEVSSSMIDNFELIKAMGMNGTETMIRTTGHGDDFASPSNAFVELCKKYKEIWLIVWGVIIFLWYPIIKPLFIWIFQRIF